MTAPPLTTRKAWLTAAIFCIAYILIQSFQEYVFRTIPPPKDPTEELLQGRLPLHIWRSALLLLSFFPLLYVFLVIVLSNFRGNPILFSTAFIGLFIFCFLEISIRSVELFYIQIQLPDALLAAKDAAVRNSILDRFSLFQSIQQALYFPLMLAQAISSFILAIAFSRKPPSNWMIKTAFAINAFRLAGRIIAMTFHVSWFNSFSGSLYLPFVVIIFGLMTVWLLKTRHPR